MSLEYIREHYGVPARRNMRFRAYTSDGRLAYEGTIWAGSHYIHAVRGPGFHPTWNIVYLNDDGSVLMDTRGR